MNNFFTSIIDWFRRHMNIQAEDKPIETFDSDFHDTVGLSITSMVSDAVSTLAISDADINIIGDSQRAKFLDDFMQNFVDTRLKTVASTTLGTGDCIVKPNTDGKRFGVDIIENGNFVVVEAVGDFVYKMLIKCDEMQKDNAVLERWELHQLHEVTQGVSYVTITQIAFKDGKEIPLSQVESWKNLQEQILIPNVDRLLFGRFKNPVTNRYDVNSPNGVPITHGADYVIDNIKQAYDRYNQEFSDKETMIFADKKLFTIKQHYKDGNVIEKSVLPQGKERVVMNMNNSSVDGPPMIHEFSPDIRDASLENALEVNFRLLEKEIGLSAGILSKSTLTYTNVDEVRKSTQQTYAFITALRKVLRSGCDDLIYAINIFMNLNNMGPIGEYDSQYDWSDSYVESMQERFTQLLQGHASEAVFTEDLRAWIMNIPTELAKEQIDERAKSNIDVAEE